MSKSKSLILAGLLSLGVSPVYAALVDLYNPGSLGNGSTDTKFQKPLSSAGWFAHYGPTAVLSQATEWSGGFVQGHVALITHAGTANAGNPYRINPVLLWTTNFTATADVQSLSEIRFTQDNPNVVTRLAIRVDGVWFVSESTFAMDGKVGKSVVKDFGSTKWNALKFNPGSVMELQSEPVTVFSDLKGTLDGIGLFYEKITDRARLRDIRVRAEIQ